ncbi:hypothetical protein [Deinococcus altitudinis]|uniref:hypothetical protein n=1 Tax=Deinococcus altitudinis TaxID=468914 RepID=UPI003891F5AA
MSTRSKAVPVSALPRPIDLTYPSNRAALLGTVVFGAATLLLGRSWRQALGVSGTALLGWATARELDPDFPLSATLALGLAGAAGLGQTERGNPHTAPAVLPGFAALSAVRILSATVGHPVSPQDAAALSVQAGVAALSGARTSALLPASALALSGTQDTLRPEAAWSAPAALGAGLLPALKRQTGNKHQAAQERPRQMYGDLLSLASLSLTRQITAPERPDSRCDQVPIRVSASRLQASRALSLGALALGLLRRESSSLLPLAAACLGTGLRRSLELQEQDGAAKR